jgi:predicted ester cyclase
MLKQAFLASGSGGTAASWQESSSNWYKLGSIVFRCSVFGLACLGALSLVRGSPESNLRGIVASVKNPTPTMAASAFRDIVGGPGAPLAKRVVVGMDTNINMHAAWNDWEAWQAEMLPFWTDDMIYDFSYVGPWAFGQSHGLWAWYNDEHLHFNAALPDSQWQDVIRAANHVNCTSASYGLARWVAPFAGVPPPADKPLVRIHDLDFYLLEGDKIKINWCIIDVVDLFTQVGYDVLPPSPLPQEGYKAPDAMDGFPAPLSSIVTPEETAASEAVWRKALQEDYLGSAGASSMWSDSVTWYGPGGVGTAHSRADYSKYFVEPLQTAFSKRTMQIDSLVCEGAYCGAHFYLYGIHAGKWLGEDASGSHVPIRCGAHARIKGGKIVQGWLIIDHARAFDAMGVDLYARAKEVALRKLSSQVADQ